MTKLRPRNARVTRKCKLFLIVLGFLLPFGGHAQRLDTATIFLPGSLTYKEALISIGGQLNLLVGNPFICHELGRPCPLHGKTTLGAFLDAVRQIGLDYQFEPSVPDPVHKKITLTIYKPSVKPPVPAPPSIPNHLHAWFTDESHQPLGGVSVEILETHQQLLADTNGAIEISPHPLPLTLFATHVAYVSGNFILKKDNMIFSLDINPQSLQAATVTPNPTTVELSTATVTTVQGSSRPYDHRSPKLTAVANATPQTLLEGQAAGLLVTQTSGIPGGAAYLTIRGQSSIINGTDPLYIIDGVPFAAGNQDLSYIPSGHSSGSLSPWSLIAPADIERIDVLRDGDATAIYGSRGANGVILITTRRWRAGLPRVDVQLSSGLSTLSKTPIFMNIRQYLANRYEALSNSDSTANDNNAPDIKILDTTRSFNWHNWLDGRAARLSDLNLDLSGGLRNDNYLAGINYLTESTPFPGQPKHRRINLHGNYNHLSANHRWSLQAAGLAAWDGNRQFAGDDPTLFQVLVPNAPPPFTSTGQLNFPARIPWTNPGATLYQPYEAHSANYLASIVSRYQLHSNLAIKATLGINHIQAREFAQTPLSAQTPNSGNTATGYFALTQMNSRSIEPELDYRRRFGRLALSAIAGGSFQHLSATAIARMDTGYASDTPLLQRRHAQLADTSSQSSSDTYTAFFGALNTTWSDRYIVNLTARRDGSSRFPPGDRYASFGSLAAAWIFSRETFSLRLFPFLSFGKLRLSQGITGNNQLGDRSLQTITGTSIQSFQSLPGLYPSQPVAEGRGWERTRKTEISLDLGFWHDRILFTATAYRHRSDNLLLSDPVQIAPTAGSQAAWPVKLENRGLEGTLTATLADKPRFGWTIGANWTFPASHLLSFPGLAQSSFADRLVIGRSINILKALSYKGVDPQTGLYTFADLNHDGKITDSDRTIVGAFDVTGFGGLDNHLRWGPFDLDILIDARIQTGVNPLAPLFLNNPPGTIQSGLNANGPTALLDHWRNPGDHARYQRLFSAPDSMASAAINHYLASSALFDNASFLRLRKLSVGYHFPAAALRYWHLSSFTVFLNAQNLLVLSPYKLADPEIQSLLVLPTMKTIEAGVRLSF